MYISVVVLQSTWGSRILNFWSTCYNTLKIARLTPYLFANEYQPRQTHKVNACSSKTMAMKTARSHQTPPLLKLGKEAEHTNKIIQWSNVVALLSVAVWLVLVSIIFYLSGPMTEDNPNYQRLSKRSCSVSNTVASFELGAILLRIIHQSNLDGTKWIKKFGNGGFNNGYVIMGMSAITNLWLANFLTPVTTDNITGMTVYPLRWAQWSVSVRRISCFFFSCF
jgi:hypothetical protein